MAYPIFRSFLQAGFECATHKIKSGNRLDLVRSTRHDELVLRDYRALAPFGIHTVREGARWHLIEKKPRTYDLGSLAVIFDAAQECGVEIILDLLHFGWPDHIDLFDPDFPKRFTEFTGEVVRFLRTRAMERVFLAPVNEISFVAWGAGDEAFLFPFCTGRGSEVKRILVKLAIESSALIRRELPKARLVAPEPVIHIVGDPAIPGSEIEAAMYRGAQFEAWDLISGKMAPELGGKPEYLDILGINFYDRNEWVHNSDVSLKRSDPRYQPFHQLLKEVWQRYQRPLFVSETGTEDDERPDWFNYICEEVLKAHAAGVPVHGICWYPIADHPGWEDNRYCANGLFGYANSEGHRPVYQPLAHAILKRQHSQAFKKFNRNTEHDYINDRSGVLFPSALELRVPEAPTPDEPLRPQ
jgi:hypothetical protein